MSTSADNDERWFRYFPGRRPEDYRWSAAVALLLGTASWGGSTLGDVHTVGQRLRDRVGDDDAWFKEWAAAGDRVRMEAEKQSSAGHALTAAGGYLRACTYYQIGERFRIPKDQPALDVYQSSLGCFRRYAELIDGPRIERVEVPFEGKALPAYFVYPEGSAGVGGPAVVFFDGLDITKELQFTQGVRELVRRGVGCLVVDGPGNGESIRYRGLPLRFDYEVAGRAALEYLAGRGDVDPTRIAVMGISLGGYFAPRCASREPRFAACVAWGAIWDYHAIWRKRVDASYDAALSVPGEHIAWVFGVESVGEALARLEDWRLEGVVGDLRCPFLVVHGEEDAQVPLRDARRLYAEAGTGDKTLKTFGPQEGGTQHCQIDNTLLGISYIADWLQEKL